MLLLVLCKIYLEKCAVWELDRLIVAQIGEARTAPVICVVGVSVVEGVSSYSLSPTPAVTVVHRGLKFEAYFTTHETCVFVESVQLNRFLGMSYG